jgi:hypothetical protein
MDPGPLSLEQVGRPIPAVTSLQGHLRIRARLGYRHRQGHRIVVNLGQAYHLAGVVHTNDHRLATMQVNSHVLLLLFHRGLLPSFTG